MYQENLTILLDTAHKESDIEFDSNSFGIQELDRLDLSYLKRNFIHIFQFLQHNQLEFNEIKKKDELS